MWKILGGVIVGVFVGAFALEILNRKRPELVRDIEKRAENAARSFVDDTPPDDVKTHQSADRPLRRHEPMPAWATDLDWDVLPNEY